MTFSLLPLRRALTLGLLACCGVGPTVSTARAQTSTWTGTVSNAWGTPGNWNHAPAFDGTDQLTLSTLKQPSQVLGANRAIHSLTFTRGGFTVTGNALTLDNSGAGISSTGSNTVGSDLYPQVPVTYQSVSGTLTLAGEVVANSSYYPDPPAAPTLTGAGNFTISGSIQGAGGIVMNGSGTLLLSGTNYYAGGLTISSGTLKLAAADTIAYNGWLFLDSGGTFDLNGVSPDIPAVRGSGTILLGSNTLTLNAGGDITYPPSFTGPISGSGGLVLKLSAGNSQSLGGTNTYTGGTTVKSGFLTYSADANLGASAGTFTLDGGGLKFAKGGTVTRPITIGSGGAMFTTDPGTTSYLPASISGNGPITYGYDTSDEGTWVASGSYTYTGTTTIATGSLVITDNAQLGAAGNAVAASGGGLLLRGGVTVSGRTITLSGLGALVSDTGGNTWSGPVVAGTLGNINVSAGSTFTLSGPVSGTSQLTVNSNGDTLISGTVGTMLNTGGSATLTLAGGNAAPGLIVSGTVVLAGGNAVSSTGGITLNSSGTLRLGASQTIGSFGDYGIAGATVDLGSHDLTLNTGGTLTGAVVGTGRLFMEGSGTLTLSGSNTFTGGLYIDSGTFVATSDASFGAAGNPVFFRGGTLQVNGSTYPSSSHPLTFSASDVSLSVTGGTFTFGQSLANTGSFTKLGAGTLVLTGTNSYAGGTVLSAGTLSVASDATLGASGGGLSLQGGTLQVTGDTFHSTARPINATAYTGFDVADAANTFTLGAITGSGGGITKLGAGTLVLAGQTTFGNASAGAGALRFGASNVLLANSSISVSTGATFDLAGFDQTAAYLGVSGKLTTGAGTLSVTSGINGYVPGGVISGHLALTGSNVNVYSNYNGAGPGGLTISAAISGSATLTMQGTGSVVLTAGGPFTGTTVVNAGTLTLTGTLLHTTGVTVAQGALLEVANGHLGVNGNVTNNGFLRLTGSATFAASGTITNNGVLDISQWNGKLPAKVVNGKGGVVLDANGLRVTQVARAAAATVQVTVNGLVGLSYQLQRATSLTLPDWQITGTSSVPQAATVNGPLVLTDGYPLAGAMGFYRVVISQTTGGSGH